jgi:hypothetical protein
MSKPSTHQEHEAASSDFKSTIEHDLPFMLDPSQKWIAVSQLQKAIRRGEANIALAWAKALWNSDRSYGLFRLAVIAAEEVAGANPALARAFLQTEIKAAWFEHRGGFDALGYFVDAFAQSTKDRTSCDLASVASLTHLSGVAASRGDLDYPALRTLAESSTESVPTRISALWLLAGTQKVSNAALGPDRPGRLVDFLGACMAICPEPDTLVCIDLSLRLNKEPNPIGLALCRAAQAQETQATRHLDVPTRKAGVALLSAVDAHTREGRQALEELLSKSEPARAMCSALSSRSDKTRLLGSIFFRLEGREVTPSLSYPMAQRAHAWHRKHLAHIARVNENELFAQADHLLPELDELRLKNAGWAFVAPKKTLKP